MVNLQPKTMVSTRNESKNQPKESEELQLRNLEESIKGTRVEEQKEKENRENGKRRRLCSHGCDLCNDSEEINYGGLCDKRVFK